MRIISSVESYNSEVEFIVKLFKNTRIYNKKFYDISEILQTFYMTRTHDYIR